MPYSRKNKKFFDLKYEKIGKKDDFLKYIIEMDKIDYSKDGIKHINIEELLFIYKKMMEKFLKKGIKLLYNSYNIV